MRRDQQILEAAERLFYQKGFDAVGVDELGKAAGVTGSAIYRHFSGKDEILAILFDHVLDAALLGLGEPLADPFEELAKLVRAHVDFTLRYRRLAGIWVREERCLSGSYRRRYERRRRRYLDRWVRALTRCYPGRPREDIMIAIRGAQLLLMSEALRPAKTAAAESTRDLLCRMTLKGLDALGEEAVQAAS